MRRKLSLVKLHIRARFMPRFTRVELARFLEAQREPEDADEDEGSDGLLFDEALGRVRHAPILPRLGGLDNEEEDVHVV